MMMRMMRMTVRTLRWTEQIEQHVVSLALKLIFEAPTRLFEEAAQGNQVQRSL
jgi:hypothetical protein